MSVAIDGRISSRRLFGNFRNRLFRTLAAGLTLTTALISSGAAPAQAEQLTLKVGVANPTMLSDSKNLNHIRVALTGFEMPGTEARPPVNTSIVIDKSGSMGGQKIAQAREAAIAAIRRLNDNDIVSVVLYADSATVLVPATKATDREAIIEKIRSVSAGGSTALFAGVSKGAAEVRKFMNEDSVNRVILLSDGQANVGPQAPNELEQLGASLVKEGISVSTLGLGLGYNEDLMSRLAAAGSGNHIFIERAQDLVAVFQKEFNDLLSVVAKDFDIRVKVANGIRPVRVLNSKADISGQEIKIPLAQLYAQQERYFVIEVEVPASESGQTRDLAAVSVKYRNMFSETNDVLQNSIQVRFTDDPKKVAKDRDPETFAYCTIQLANSLNCMATELRDAGKVDEAQKLLRGNTARLAEVEDSYGAVLPAGLAKELKRNVSLNEKQAIIIKDPKQWAYGRKAMRYEQAKNAAQQQAD